MTKEQVVEEVKNYENYPNGLSKECRDYILKALEQEPRWIPVSERLPDIHNYSEYYLVTLKNGEVHRAMCTEMNGEHWWNYNLDDVIAWMPLLQAYREVEE